MSNVTVSVAQSLGTVGGSRPPDTPIRRILALVDESIREAGPVLEALDTIADLPNHRVTHAQNLADAIAAGRHDLVVLFCHGSGVGLDYHLMLPGGPAGAFDIARARLADRAIIAACSSGSAPPAGFPLTLAGTLMTHGTTTILAGLWPLPVRPTARLVSQTLIEIGDGHDLVEAIRRARPGTGGPVLDRCGLHLFGSLP